MPPARSWGALLAVAALAAPLAVGQEGEPRPEQPPTLPPVGVELVQVDAVVTDKEGRAVSGLTAADFEVKEDGRVQPLAYFGFESRPGAAVPPIPAPRPATPAAVVPPPPPPPVEHPRGRTIVIVVDDLHIAPTNLVAAREALARFVREQVGADDEVALVTTSGTTLAQELTRDREALVRAIARTSLVQQRRVAFGDVPHLTEHQAELIDRGDPEALRVAVAEIRQENDDLDEGLARLQAAQRAHSMLVEIMSYTRQTLGMLEEVVRSLGPLPGRKMVVLASDGFLIGLGASDTRHFDVRRIADAATRSGVVLYSLDTRGLVSEVPGGDATFGGPPVLTAPGARESLERRSIEALRDSLFALAEDTGGFLVRNSNDLDQGLARILADDAHYYLLAYPPANRRADGKFRKIEVRLPRHPGLRVRTRSGYYAPDDRTSPAAATPASAQERRDLDLARALFAVLPVRGIPVKMVADYALSPRGDPTAVVKANVDVRTVAFESAGDHYEAEIDTAGAVFDEAGRKVRDIDGESSRLNLPLDDFEMLRAQGLLYEKAVPLDPGRYLVRLGVREAGSGRLGSASAWVDVPDRHAQPLGLSAVFLYADRGQPREGERAELQDIQVEKRLGRYQGLHYLLDVYGGDGGPPGPRDVTVQAQVWAGEKLVGVGPRHTLALEGPVASSASHAERIDLHAFAPGTYELRVVVQEAASGLRAERHVSFAVD